MVQGVDVLQLEPGQRLQLGSQAVIEIVKARTGCLRLAAAQGHTQLLQLGGIGVLARVVSGGPINVGDAVFVLETVYHQPLSL